MIDISAEKPTKRKTILENIKVKIPIKIPKIPYKIKFDVSNFLDGNLFEISKPGFFLKNLCIDLCKIKAIGVPIKNANEKNKRMNP